MMLLYSNRTSIRCNCRGWGLVEFPIRVLVQLVVILFLILLRPMGVVGAEDMVQMTNGVLVGEEVVLILRQLEQAVLVVREALG